MNTSITKRFDFDTAHRIPNHNGKCRNIHGHRYSLEVTLRGGVSSEEHTSSEGMIIDFQDLKTVVKKSIIDKWDHALLLFKGDPLLNNSETFTNIRLIKTDYIPTAENMAKEAYQILYKEFAKLRSTNPVTVINIRLYETPKAWVDVGS